MAMTGKKKKIGLADVLILLLIIAVIGAAVIFYFSGHTFGSGDAVQITYEVRVTKVRSELTSHVNYGDKVWDSVYGEYIGVVEKVRTEQYTEQVVDRATGTRHCLSRDNSLNLMLPCYSHSYHLS